MIKSKGIFAVSFIAMMVVGGAYANIASQGYVDQQVDAKQNASTAVKVAAAGTAVGDTTHPVYVNASGVATRIDKVAAATSADTATSATKATQDASGNVITTTYATKTELNAKADAEDIPTINNATLTIQKNGTAVATFTANSATGATANITVPTKVSELTNDSGFITAASLPGEYELKPATADALGGVKSGGDITVGTDGTVTVNGKLSSISGSTGGTGNVVTSVSASGSTVTATKSITAEETKNKVTTVRSKDSATDTAYPSEKAVATALEGKLSTTGTAAKATADASGNNIANTYATKAQLTALDSTSSGSGAVVTNVSQTDGKVSVTKGNVQIPVGSATATSYATIWVQ